MFTEKQIKQLSGKGISIEQIKKQLKYFREGIEFLALEKPALIENSGIVRLSDAAKKTYIDKYIAAKSELDIVKFVPASGAASRMFKTLFEFLDGASDSIGGNSFLEEFFANINKFAFYNDLKRCLMESGMEIDQLILDKKYKIIIDFLLTDKGLNYGNKPKAVLMFHNYDEQARTSLEEHLVEAARYASNGLKASIHFTVSPDHKILFDEVIQQSQKRFEDEFNIQYQIEFSEQKPSTDTIAVNMENEPFIDDNEEMLFRPGGHGALIENLNELRSQIIFIKNIDNVVPDSLKDETTAYKQALAGLLLDIQQKVFSYIKKLQKDDGEEMINEISKFYQCNLGFLMPEDFVTKSRIERKEYLIQLLNRPIRVCGMVKNEGEPGGGPFWVRQKDGSVSLQIVETSQINLEEKNQASIQQQASHFNPVDLVCSVYNYMGEKFDLKKFIDPDTGFISKKSKNGKDLKALELPGLWNGAMANWNTVFVEVPLITFNPVKTVNDLLRKQHQA